ncbi:MAG: hypothetical protein ACPGEG_05240 [Salibacteraceae bacterium]
MKLLDQHQVNQVNDALVEQGIGYDELRQDLLDHICCMIEQEINRDKSFEMCLENALETFGKENFKVIEESTLYLLNQKLNKMKKVISVLGLVASVMVMLGVFFKVNHIVGAGVLLVCGVSIISVIVLPLLGYLTFKANSDKQTKTTSLVGYASVILISMGGLFKLMHWPFANILFWLGMGVLVLGFIPLHTLRTYRLAENKLFSLAKSMLVLAGFIFLVSISSNSKLLKLEDQNHNGHNTEVEKRSNE